jgi:phenylpyruvate tautomerase PptA (4-oxalocrotonate tautomerase family)
VPISIQLTRGLLTEEAERSVFARVAHALADVHGLAGNDFMTANVIGHVEVFPEESSYVGGRAQSLAVIEVKVPSITFPSREVQQAFVQRATDIIDELRAGPHPKTRTFVNVTYAVDGAWGIAGKAYSNEELVAAIAENPR